MTQYKSQMIASSFKEIFEDRTPGEIRKEEERLISFRFLSEVEKAMEKGYAGITNKKELARRVGTSPSYITQLFRGDRLVNIPMLNKMAKALDLEISVEMRPKKFEERLSDINLPEISRPEGVGVWVYKRMPSKSHDPYTTVNSIRNVSYNEDMVA